MERYPERCFHIIVLVQYLLFMNQELYKNMIFYLKQIKIMSTPQWRIVLILLALWYFVEILCHIPWKMCRRRYWWACKVNCQPEVYEQKRWCDCAKFTGFCYPCGTVDASHNSAACVASWHRRVWNLGMMWRPLPNLLVLIRQMHAAQYSLQVRKHAANVACIWTELFQNRTKVTPWSTTPTRSSHCPLRGRPWRYSVILITPDFPTEYQVRRHSNPAGLPTFAAIWGADFRASIIRLTCPHVFKQINKNRITLMTMFKANRGPPN